MKTFDQYIKAIEKDLKKKTDQIETKEVGTVYKVNDGVAQLTGLDNISFGEIVEFSSGVKGFVIDLTEDYVGVVVLGDYLKIKAGEMVTAQKKQISVPVSQNLLGRVINPIGEALDGLEKIETNEFYPVEKIAPGVVTREPVNVALQTGIKAIDALIPIGRGQRELIIGDRRTGKTTIAIDTIINQKGKDVICIYCAIGQKRSKIASIVELLERKGALEYTIIVAASASTPVSLQYLAPYSACAVGEYFMSQGKDVLVVYDDLTKHAWAYRQLSLVLRRPAGREAYPGDIFYLHSRLLERACRLNKKYGGGSLTALPIIETLEGDLSTYIPTNVISITDGQIFLETDLFNAGIRPAINVGASVSRVGSSAQSKAMKQVASRLKLDLAQYREMAAFSQFESELDEETKKLLNRGAKVTQVLKQKKNNPYRLSLEVAVIWAAVKGYLDTVTLDKVGEFEEKLVEDLSINGKDLLDAIDKKKVLDEKDEKKIAKFIGVNLPKPKLTNESKRD